MRAVASIFLSGPWMLPLFAAALAVLAQGVPATAEASGGDIRVVEAYQQVNYPNGVSLSITIESEAEISEVRVYYRPAGSRKWGYAYPQFDPGRRVVATQSIPVLESTYIAPGADVEYYYHIRDIDGNVLETNLAAIEYLDQRFNWKRVNVGPLELVYHDIKDSRIEDAVKELSKDLERVQRVLGVERPRAFKGVIYNSYADANAAFPVQSQTTTDHGTFAGYAFPEQRVFLGNGLDRRIIVHESTHLMIRDALGNRSVEMPAWLNEGFATYMEPNVRIRSSEELIDRTPHLKAMASVSGTPETIPLFYQKSVSVVAHLIETYGEERFRLLLAEIARGRETDSALLKVYGFDDHGLDSSWAGLPISAPEVPEGDAGTGDEARGSTGQTGQTEERTRPEKAETRLEQQESNSSTEAGTSNVATSSPPQGNSAGGQQSASDRSQQSTQPQQPQQRGEPSPFVFFDVWILAGVAILAAVVVFGRFVYSRMRRRDDDPEDASRGWEPDDRGYQ